METGTKSFLRATWVAALPLVALAIELFGGWRYSDGISIGRLYWPLVSFTIGAVMLSPVLVAYGLAVALRERKRLGTRRGLYQMTILVLIMTLMVSMFSCFWTCGGHPTWTNGYSGSKLPK